jgi:hypothetical protein
MHYLRLAIVILLLGGLTSAGVPEAAAAETERPVSGVITHVDPVGQVIYVGPVRFEVPEAIYDLDELTDGVRAVVHFTREGQTRTATEIRLDDRPH